MKSKKLDINFLVLLWEPSYEGVPVAKKLISSLILLILFIVASSFSAEKVYAHVLQSNGSVGAVLHIDPEDDPIVGQQASFFFEFKDKQNKFNPENCTCIFSILENGKEIFSQPLFQSNTDLNSTNTSVFYTFAKRDVYQVKISGKPFMEKKAFDPFTLTYDIRVSRESEGNNSQSNTRNWLSAHMLHIAIFVGGLILLIGIFGMQKKRKSVKLKQR